MNTGSPAQEMVNNYLLHMITDMENAGFDAVQVAAGLIGTLEAVLENLDDQQKDAVGKAAMESLSNATGWNLAIVEIKPTDDTLLH
jgi:hypothetical protein